MISVSMQTSEIATAFDTELTARLALLGFHKCPAGHFVKTLGPGVSGYFGYALYTDRRSGEVRAWPVAGVRFHEVERLVSDLMGREFDEHGGFTIGKPIGFFMPRWDLAEWVVNSAADAGRVADEVVAALEEYGLPFMENHALLSDAVEAMSPEQLGGGHDGARLAATYFLLGEGDKATKVIDHQLARFAKGGYPGAADFQKFARNLRSRVEASQTE
jgi:hypothetical protein